MPKSANQSRNWELQAWLLILKKPCPLQAPCGCYWSIFVHSTSAAKSVISRWGHMLSSRPADCSRSSPWHSASAFEVGCHRIEARRGSEFGTCFSPLHSCCKSKNSGQGDHMLAYGFFSYLNDSVIVLSMTLSVGPWCSLWIWVWKRPLYNLPLNLLHFWAPSSMKHLTSSRPSNLGWILSTRVGYHRAIQDLFSPTQMILVLNVIRCMFGKEFFHRQIDPHCVDVVLHKLLSLQYNAILRFLRHVIRKSLSVFVIFWFWTLCKR